MICFWLASSLASAGSPCLGNSFKIGVWLASFASGSRVLWQFFSSKSTARATERVMRVTVEVSVYLCAHARYYYEYSILYLTLKKTRFARFKIDVLFSSWRQA